MKRTFRVFTLSWLLVSNVLIFFGLSGLINFVLYKNPYGYSYVSSSYITNGMIVNAIFFLSAGLGILLFSFVLDLFVQKGLENRRKDDARVLLVGTSFFMVISLFVSFNFINSIIVTYSNRLANFANVVLVHSFILFYLVIIFVRRLYRER